MNLNKLAKDITLKEGGRKQVSIAQVKEIMKLLFIELADNYMYSDVLKTLEKYEGKSIEESDSGCTAG